MPLHTKRLAVSDSRESGVAHFKEDFSFPSQGQSPLGFSFRRETLLKIDVHEGFGPKIIHAHGMDLWIMTLIFACAGGRVFLQILFGALDGNFCSVEDDHTHFFVQAPRALLSGLVRYFQNFQHHWLRDHGACVGVRGVRRRLAAGVAEQTLKPEEGEESRVPIYKASHASHDERDDDPVEPE